VEVVEVALTQPHPHLKPLVLEVMEVVVLEEVGILAVVMEQQEPQIQAVEAVEVGLLLLALTLAAQAALALSS
jgi:hypothetical protein